MKKVQGINWRQILIHFIGSWFIIHGFEALAYLADVEVAKLLRTSGPYNTILLLTQKEHSSNRLQTLLEFVALAKLVALPVVVALSIIVSLKNSWHWLNSFFVLGLIILFGRLRIFEWSLLKRLLSSPGRLFNDPFAYILVNGLILLVLGILLFTLPQVNRFIEGKMKMSKK